MRLWDQISRLLIVGAPREQRETVQTHVDRNNHTQRRIEVFKLLARDTERDVIHPRAAILLRDAAAEKPELRHLRQQAAVELVRTIEIVDSRCNRASTPLAHALLEQLLLFSKIEIDHGKRRILAWPGIRYQVSGGVG